MTSTFAVWVAIPRLDDTTAVGYHLPEERGVLCRVEALDRLPWSDPLGRPGYERKLYLYSAWGPLRPQQMFEVDGPV